MPFVPVPAVAEVELRYLWDTQNCENTLYFESGDPIDAGLLLNLAEAIEGWWETNVQPLLSSDVALNEVFSIDLTTSTGPVASFTTGLPLLGSVGVEAVPANVAPCISFKTANRGRSFRGRNYLIGLPNSFVAGNHMAADWMANMVEAYQALNAAVASQGFAHVVVSRFSGSTIVGGIKVPTPRVTGLSTAVTTYSFVDDVVDSQRGRLPNH